MSSDKDYKSPSQKAIDLARQQMEGISPTVDGTSTQEADANIIAQHNSLRDSLFKYVIDCWVTFTNLALSDNVPTETPKAADTTKIEPTDNVPTPAAVVADTPVMPDHGMAQAKAQLAIIAKRDTH